MNEEYNISYPEVTKGQDGVYRWMYELDMKNNRSMLYMLLRIFAAICAGCCVLWILMLGMKGVFRAESLPKIIFIWLLITAGVEAIVWLGYEISRKFMHDEYQLRFEMDDLGIKIYQSEETMARRKQRTYGRKYFSDVVSETPFNTVLGISVYRQWDMIDLNVIGGKFQVYVHKADFDMVLDYILDRVPHRVSKAFRGK